MWQSSENSGVNRGEGRTHLQRIACVAALISACLVCSGPLMAETHGTVQLKYLGRGEAGALWSRVDVKVDSDRNGYWDWRAYDVTAGQYPFIWNGDDSNLLTDESRSAFNDNPTNPYIYGNCIDIDDGVGPSYYYATFKVQDLAGMTISGSGGRELSATSAAYLTEHFARHYDLVDTPEEAASFATVVWEIMYEDAGDYDENSGWVRTDDADYTTAWLNDLDGTVFDDVKVFALVNKCYQDMAMPVFGFSGGTADPIPEPLTFLSVFLAVGGLGSYVRKRRLTA